MITKQDLSDPEQNPKGWSLFIQHHQQGSDRHDLHPEYLVHLQDPELYPGVRCLAWRLCFGLLPKQVDICADWMDCIHSQRMEYEHFIKKLRLEPSQSHPGDVSAQHPLSIKEDSLWQVYFKDQELLKMIELDVERTLPEEAYFRTERVQASLKDILFVYCKVHHRLSYRQGMHELLAMVYRVVEEEMSQMDRDPSPTSPMGTLLDPRFLDHDVYALFTGLMALMADFYHVEPDTTAPQACQKQPCTKHRKSGCSLCPSGEEQLPSPSASSSPLKSLCTRIASEWLPRFDAKLAQHLTRLGLEPQFYLIKWVRLLFGRELPYPELLILWDYLLSVSYTHLTLPTIA